MLSIIDVCALSLNWQVLLFFFGDLYPIRQIAYKNLAKVSRYTVFPNYYIYGPLILVLTCSPLCIHTIEYHNKSCQGAYLGEIPEKNIKKLDYYDVMNTAKVRH